MSSSRPRAAGTGSPPAVTSASDSKIVTRRVAADNVSCRCAATNARRRSVVPCPRKARMFVTSCSAATVWSSDFITTALSAERDDGEVLRGAPGTHGSCQRSAGEPCTVHRSRAIDEETYRGERLPPASRDQLVERWAAAFGTRPTQGHRGWHQCRHRSTTRRQTHAPVDRRHGFERYPSAPRPSPACLPADVTAPPTSGRSPASFE